jgi:hypothetical protein
VSARTRLDAAPRQRQKSGMKISTLVQVAFVSVFVAVPAVAAPLSAVGSSAPISLCGEDKAEKGEKAETTDKADKKTDKKDSKEKKGDNKGSA